ncbi:MAG: TetR/AcrR family transcriptional regulator [Burkholderiales bacterium]
MPPSTAPSPQTPRFQVKREAILSAAALLFNEQGVKGATLSGIAGSVGLVTNSVTYYYRKKEDLATACFLRSIATFDTLAETAAKESGVPARLRAFFRLQAQLLADIEENRHAPIVRFNDIRALPEPQATEVFAAYTSMFRRVRGLLKGAETSQLARDDLNARGHIVLSVAHWVRSWIGHYETADYLRVADRVSDILLHGIAAPGSTWKTTDGESTWQLANGTDNTSEAFLRAATLLVNEQGYRGASVDKISARLNVTKGSFYHHNDNKHDLISECFERSFAVTRQALALAENSPGSGWSRVCAAARALVRFQISADGPLLRTSATSALPDQPQRERVRVTLRRLTERMANVVVDGMMDGSIRPLDPGIAAQSAIAAINAAAELHRWAPDANLDNVADLYARPALEGVLCPGHP